MRRRWPWLFIPVVGIGIMFALPPMDEYAALERIGTSFDRLNAESHPIPPNFPSEFRSLTERSQREAAAVQLALDGENGISHRRAWKMDASNAATKKAVDRLFSPSFGWQQNGSGSGSTMGDGPATTSEMKMFFNNETGDTAEVTVETPAPAGEGMTVKVAESQTSHQIWPRLKRWVHRLFVQ